MTDWFNTNYRVQRRVSLLGNIPLGLTCAIVTGAAGSLMWLGFRAIFPLTADWVAGLATVGAVFLAAAWLQATLET